MPEAKKEKENENVTSFVYALSQDCVYNNSSPRFCFEKPKICSQKITGLASLNFGKCNCRVIRDEGYD